MSNSAAIGTAQTTPRPGDVAANTEEHVRLARLASAQGVRLLVFPELSLTGYELELAEELSFSENDPRLEPLRDEAARLEMTLIVGVPMRLEGHLHLASSILSPDGGIDVYTKHRLGAFPSSAAADGVVPPPEASVFVPGTRNPLIGIGSRTAALAICADIGNPAHAQAAAERGATVYLASMFVIPPDFAVDTERLRGYAADLGMVVAFANFGGETGGLPSAGASAIWSDAGELLAQMGRVGSGVVFAEEQGGGWRAGSAALSRP